MAKAQNETEALLHMDESWRRSGNQLSGMHKRWVAAKLRALEAICAATGGPLTEVLEMGVGDGAYWELLDPQEAKAISYLGVDGSQLILDAAMLRTIQRDSWLFVCAAFGEFIERGKPDAEVVLALDVLYHLPTDGLFEDFVAWLFGPGVHQYVLTSWATDLRQTFCNAKQPGDPGFAWFARDLSIPEDWECIHSEVASGIGMSQRQALGVFRRRG